MVGSLSTPGPTSHRANYKDESQHEMERSNAGGTFERVTPLYVSSRKSTRDGSFRETNLRSHPPRQRLTKGKTASVTQVYSLRA